MIDTKLTTKLFIIAAVYCHNEKFKAKTIYCWVSQSWTIISKLLAHDSTVDVAGGDERGFSHRIDKHWQQCII
jgi:hypothetical protein